jgi:hypothetical protein
LHSSDSDHTKGLLNMDGGINYSSAWWFGTWILGLSIYYIRKNNPNRLSYFSEGLEPPTRENNGKYMEFW